MSSVLANALVELFGDEEVANRFQAIVDDTNDIAETRISRSTVDTSQEEAVEAEDVERTVEDVVEEVEAVEEETEVVEVEAVEEVAEEDEIVLGETFVEDLVNSEEFRSALRSIVNQTLADVVNRVSALEQEAEETRQIIDDVPPIAKKDALRKRTVTFRPRDVGESNGSPAEQKDNYQNLANSTLANIRGGA